MSKKTLTPINIPPEVNTWEALQEEAKLHPDKAPVVAAMRDMFDHFGVPEDERLKLGDLVQRFSMMLALNGSINLTSDDRRLHALADMTEWFQSRAEDLLADHILGAGNG